jgi:hypothetical protein
MASKKSPNFTELEKTVLIELVDSRKGIIEVKFGDFLLAIADPIYHQNLNPGISCIRVRNC